MAKMRILIRIVFVIFIANGIDCLGRVCDNCCDCCDCFKKKEIKKYEEIEKYEEIKEDEENTAKSLVNYNWFKAKENNLVLKIFKKKDNDISPSKDNVDKISIKLDGNNNSKIAYLQKKGDPLNLKGKKYALFEIKMEEGENTVYLYCSDVETSNPFYGFIGIFEKTTHVSISVIACDTEKVTDVNNMFFGCSGLTVLDLEKFNTTNVKNMMLMFANCSSLTKLDLKNFNTTNVEDMEYMFSGCCSLKNLELGKDFNTTNVTTMSFMFCNCKNLTELEIVEKFNTTNVKDCDGMFNFCKEDIKNKILGKNE